ncbi:sigma-54-dependent transcriptional regulator [Ningiella sp. W23]|uniref:sigma-54-dependent transcriptional regulator n=1 Tax=Ningiella sp. W23 TaxID=3023715 RepID=UPI0037566A94
MLNSTILVADDQKHIRDSLELLLEPEGYSLIQASSPPQILDKVRKHNISLILMDMNYATDTTSGQEGLALIEKLREMDSKLPILVMTAWANIELSVKAMKLGANDFVEKPWNNLRLLSLISNQCKLANEQKINQKWLQLNRQDNETSDFVALSITMQNVIKLIERTAATDANILLTGESGVGKSLIAGLIHNSSNRKDKSFVSVNMGALADTLFESELFGHQKGAFTDAKSTRIGRFEMAEGGTLFLDEIANIPLPLQAKLLRVLESGEFESLGSSKTVRADVRIISASNVNFEQEIESGRFRQDLLYRLNTIVIDIPPLRKRPEDLLPLAEQFLRAQLKKYRRTGLKFSDEALKAIRKYHWPGNVRELSHCIERSVLMAMGTQIMAQDLGIATAALPLTLDNMTLEQAEQSLIQSALQKHNGNVSEAADQLGISRAALYRRLEKYGNLE